ncbi:TetR family transcriptional regulator [Paenarthrobacter aurescens]|uniref:Transcriptional regulator n=1 Tax=Paenarthrobacter aurescens TaxID=43663 RepID=A0A4Y3NCI3_PAEAU|nr:TetR family transcriptional regulator [Paenarthrobacter aurescens]MDO6145422.1 TetR family transcriptional regulator [Paenarthrobacter aurescens]MDO6149227.1 TetR family transcriptional regulator [Paenarthrobacter aurescens]MDO6160471.1 TetR family transcriptional regulator [Paenarthrobacter aurescens]MDO6164330.1 TetR family transcriptional regulator [Paenarthrobacter aurescens]GEB19550.1 transcriptional regulator [Paenarthrobacter aurescens]
MAKVDKKEIRRQEIVAAAQAVAARDGAEGATLRAIAAEAGMAANAVLYYFGSHAEIIAAAVQASSGRFLEKLAESVDPGMSPTARLAAVISAGTTAGLDDDVSRILYEYWPHMLRDAGQRRIQEELTKAQERVYRDIIDAGTSAGEFTPLLDPAKIARTLVAQEDGLVMDVLAGSASSEYVLDLMGNLAAALLGLKAENLLELIVARGVSAPAR